MEHDRLSPFSLLRALLCVVARSNWTNLLQSFPVVEISFGGGVVYRLHPENYIFEVCTLWSQGLGYLDARARFIFGFDTTSQLAPTTPPSLSPWYTAVKPLQCTPEQGHIIIIGVPCSL